MYEGTEDRIRDIDAKGAVGNTGSLCDIPELLSPAGDMECLKAAVAGGCDAAYAASDRYGARAYAANFSKEDYLRAIDYMHLFGRKLYLTLNTLIKEDEFADLYDFLKPFADRGLDGVIVQDLGVASFILREFPDLPVHASTQMSVSSSFGAAMLKEMGIVRVVPSRELSLGEIKTIIGNTGIELECFIHGAMCYSYSGMCLMSSFLGGRSGNRGRCAGPCRQPYSAGNQKESYLLSMKDLCTIDILDQLVMAGISSFKIEGRMKSPGYVYGVTSIYRRYLDRIIKAPGDPYRVDPEDREKLKRIYSRGGISEGYYHRRNGADLVTMTRGSYKNDEEEQDIPVMKIPLRAELRAETGSPMELTLRESRGSEIKITGDTVDAAKSRPMSEDDYRKQMAKTGDSVFAFEEINVICDGEGFVPVSRINALRREAIAAMEERMLDDNKRRM